MAQARNILVLGATGVTGLQFIPMALSHSARTNLTLYVRSRSKLPSKIQTDSRVRIVEGSLNDLPALKSAMSGIDTVLSFLGAYVSLSAFIWRTKTTAIADSFPTIFSAMRFQGTKRILALSTPSGLLLGTDQPPLSWRLYNNVPPFAVPQGHAEMKGIAQHVAAQTDLEWTVMRVPQLTEGKADLKVAAGPLDADYKGGKQLSRASYVKWILGEIEERKWIGGAPMLANEM